MAAPRAENPRPRRRRLRWLTAVLYLLALGLHLYLVGDLISQPLGVNALELQERPQIWPLFNDTVHREGPGADFFAVYHAGRCLEHGVSPYGFTELPADAPYYYRFRYLPVVGQTLGRLSGRLTPVTAWRAWVLVLEVILAALIWVVRRQAGGALWPCLITCLLLTASPYFLELHMGQFTFLAVSLAVAALIILDRSGFPRWPAWTATAIGSLFFVLAVLLKVFPLVLLPVLLRRRRWWLVAAVAVLIMVLTASPHFLAHPDDWQAFRSMNLTTPTGSVHAGNFSFPYLVYLLVWQPLGGGENTAWFVSVGVWRVLLLAGTAVAVLAARKVSPLGGAAALLLAHFVSYPQVWEHHLSGVLVAGLLVALSWQRERAGPRCLIWIAGLALVLLAVPTPFVWLDRAKDATVTLPSGDWSLAARIFLVAVKALPTLALYAVSLVLIGRGGWGRSQPRVSGVSAAEPSQGL